MSNNFGFVKVGAAVPLLKVADCEYNVQQMIEIINEAESKGVSILSFPELSITGYTCGDLFHQDWLLKSAEKEFHNLRAATYKKNMIVIVGMPIRRRNQTFNCAVVLHDGKILGVVPKNHLPNYGEFYEKRWFSSGLDSVEDTITFDYEVAPWTVPFSPNLIFQDANNKNLNFAIELCEDVWTVIPPSSTHTILGGANLIFNLSASNELIGKYNYRKSLIEQQSARCIAGYIYTSAGIGESTTDVVFSGSAMIYENGLLLEESERFSLENELIISEIDLEYLQNCRNKNTGFSEPALYLQEQKYRLISFALYEQELNLTRKVNHLPFVPSNSQVMFERCNEILNIQAAGLLKRIKHIGTGKSVIGISGGLDSTLALLVQIRAYDKLKLDRKGIIGITMPGFGTTGRTYNNALQLMHLLGITIREISIKDACIQHFKDIGIDDSVHDITYENSQARERTQILMDVANKENAIVVGTGDLSELALGWATYNGDHMSMYGVNASIPKTLVRYLVQFAANEMKNSTQESDKKAADILEDIINTPVSPELIPPSSDGTIVQKTEEIIGNYDLNDFFLYQMIKCGFEPAKIYYLAKIAFKDIYLNDYILKHMKTFYSRFFNNQFKRSCLPDGIKVGSVSLSPRGDWRMPSDASANIWLSEIDKIEKEENEEDEY